MSDIRTLTYSNCVSANTGYRTSKWKQSDDSVFNILGAKVDSDYQVRIADFLNLFYYFIICYSKTCFKRNAKWTKYKKNLQNGLFSYDIANSNNSHKQILDIQSIMYRYRDQFSKKGDLFFTDDKIKEIKQFIDESLDLLCNDIQEPVQLISSDVIEKIKKYKGEKQERDHKHPKKSTKLNYDVIAKLIADGVITATNIS